MAVRSEWRTPQAQLPAPWPWPAADPRRYKRVLSSRDLHCGYDALGMTLCRWCQLPILAQRRICYCSDACSTEASYRYSPNNCEPAVFRRDGGRCALCRKLVSTCAIDPILRERLRQQFGDTMAWGHFWHRVWHALYTQATEWHRRTHPIGGAPHLYELDHIVPVIEGGGGCGPEGYRILCRRCHPKETGKLRRRLHAAKRPQQALPLFETGAP